MLVYGQPAPDFTEKGVDENTISLKSFEGKFVLIDFWGSWCLPCRKENPILVMMYDRYKDRKFKTATGFTILSVALEDNISAAKNAIIRDGLIWPYHIIQLHMLQSPMAKLFGVNQIPAKYLVDPKGRILLANPDIKELDDFLAKESL